VIPTRVVILNIQINQEIIEKIKIKKTKMERYFEKNNRRMDNNIKIYQKIN
jgi:hypothetical protein